MLIGLVSFVLGLLASHWSSLLLLKVKILLKSLLKASPSLVEPSKPSGPTIPTP